jgi:hypothetical protein
MTNKNEMENINGVENRDTLCPEGIYHGVLKDVVSFDTILHTGCSTKVVRLVFELNSNGEERIHHLIEKNYILSLAPGRYINEVVSYWRGYEITPEEQNQGIAFLESLKGWPVDLEIFHVRHDSGRLIPMIRSIDPAGTLFMEKHVMSLETKLDLQMDALTKHSQRITNRFTLMKNCINEIRCHLDRDTTLPIIIENLDKLEYSLSLNLDPEGILEPAVSSVSNN